jgi:hypothetical protein
MEDNRSLKQLANLHLGLGVLVFVSFPLLFVLSLAVMPSGEGWAPVWLAWLLVLVALAAVFMASSRALDVRSHRRFSLACGLLALLLVPVGTAIGVYTLVVLTRADIVADYARGRLHWQD